MKLIVVSSPHLLANEAFIINQLFSAGMGVFHLRKPGASLDTIKALLDQINPAFLPMVVLHQHHDLKATYNLVRLHYPKALLKETDPSIITSYARSGVKLSTSIHDLELLSSSSIFHYVFYSPVFDSISKPGYCGKLTSDFKLAIADGDPAVIALGGINHHNIQQLSAMNFDGAAVLGAIWNAPGNPIENFLRLNYALNMPL
jgi:thiamine-phosphate pyrophosphorylase